MEDDKNDLLILTIGKSHGTDGWYYKVLYYMCYSILTLVLFVLITNRITQDKLKKTFPTHHYTLSCSLFFLGVLGIDLLCTKIRENIILIPSHDEHEYHSG